MLHNFASECRRARRDGLCGQHPETAHKLIHSFCGLLAEAPGGRALVRRQQLDVRGRGRPACRRSGAALESRLSPMRLARVRDHSGRRLADLAPDSGVGHRGRADHRAFDPRTLRRVPAGLLPRAAPRPHLVGADQPVADHLPSAGRADRARGGARRQPANNCTHRLFSNARSGRSTRLSPSTSTIRNGAT